MMSPNSHILWLGGSKSSTRDGSTSSRFCQLLEAVLGVSVELRSAMAVDVDVGVDVLYGSYEGGEVVVADMVFEMHRGKVYLSRGDVPSEGL